MNDDRHAVDAFIKQNEIIETFKLYNTPLRKTFIESAESTNTVDSYEDL
jgi:hypothetical protein